MTNNQTVVRRTVKRSRSYIFKRNLSKWSVSIGRALLMFGLCFMIIQPMVTRFCTSLMPEADLYDSTIILLPRNPTLINYKYVADITQFPTSMINSAWITVLVSALQVAASTLVAYGFARYEFPLKKFWFACVVAMIIIPPQTMSMSLNLQFTNFDPFGLITLFGGKPINVKGSVLPYCLMCLTCMGLKDGLYIYMLRQYFKGIPTTLEEAAYVDGCGTMHTFLKIMLPDAMPTVLSCFLFSVVWQWTDLFYTRNFLRTTTRPMYSHQLSILSSAVNRYFSSDASKPVILPNGRVQQLISIGVLICCIPLIILYLFTQKTFVQSIAMSGSKE